MDSHSRGNKGLPKGFPLPGETGSVKSSKIISPKSVSIPGTITIKRSSVPPGGSYVISRAYEESVGLDPIEQLLLQRDYIID